MEQGGQVPHFDVVDITGRRVAYADIWQRQHLVLVTLDDAGGVARPDVAAVVARAPDIRRHDAVLVVTTEPIADLPRPGAIVADRWGEVQTIISGIPDPNELIDWVEYVQHRCPECEGEAR